MKTKKRKRKPGITTGNAGEYFVMGELLKRGFDAQLADRNTKGYDVLVGRANEPNLRKVQVKTGRAQSQWYVKRSSFEGKSRNQVTIYVSLGQADSEKPVRYFIAKNRDLAKYVHKPSTWRINAVMPMKAVKQYENCWNALEG